MANTSAIRPAVTASSARSGGNNSIAVLLSLGTVAGTGGTLNLSGGTVTVPNVAVGGNSGTVSGGAGVLNVSGNGVLLATNITIFNAASSLNLTGGTVSTAAIFTPDWGRVTFVGGTLNLTGGISSNSGDLKIGGGLDTKPVTLNLGGGTLAVGNFEDIGSGVAATFNQTGGIHDPTYLHVAEGGGIYGTYNLIGGAINDTGDMRIAAAGIGFFVQSGGTNTVTGNNLSNPYGLGIGELVSAYGSYTLIAGLLSVSNSEFIGSSGFGMFSQTNGTHTIGGGSIGGSIYLGGSTLGSHGIGSYFLSGGTLNVHDTEFVGYAGSGQLIQSGGTNSANALSVAVNGSSGTVQLSGGALTIANTTLNNGTINHTGGSANLGVVTGTGSLFVGNTAGAAVNMNVASFTQGAVTIRNTGTLTVATNAARFTNTATALNIAIDPNALHTTFNYSNNGNLDLGNHTLFTSTDPATIKIYLQNGYDAFNNADWGGRGITSSFVHANPIKYSLAYASGSDTSAQDAGIAVSPGQVFVRPVLTGDANMDGTVDFFDISQVLGYKYNTGQAASYTDGDLNYDGEVDFFDISTILSANYNSGVVFGPAAGPATASSSESTATAALAIALRATASVPEPGGMLTLVAALGGAASLRSRRRSRRR
jgi:hypothetical protein